MLAPSPVVDPTLEGVVTTTLSYWHFVHAIQDRYDLLKYLVRFDLFKYIDDCMCESAIYDGEFH